MEDEPQGLEVRIARLLHDALQVELQKAGARQGTGAPQEAKAPPVHGDAPTRRLTGVQKFLEHLEGRLPPASSLDAEVAGKSVKSAPVGGDRCGQPAVNAVEQEGDGIAHPGELDRAVGLADVRVSQDVPEEVADVAAGSDPGVGRVLAEGRGELRPLGLRDMEGTAVLAGELQSFGHGIVLPALERPVAQADLFEEVGREKRPLEPDRIEDQGMEGWCGAVSPPGHQSASSSGSRT